MSNLRIVIGLTLLFTLVPFINGKCLKLQDTPLDEGEYKNVPIGEAFDLSNTDFYSTLTQGNTIIDKEQAKECFRLTEVTNGKAFLETSNTLESVYRSVSKEADLSSEFTYYITLKSSLQSISSSINWRNSQAKTSQVDYSHQVKTLSSEMACIREHFTESFKKDLETLDVDIQNPAVESSWQNYESFIKQYGSHIMSSIFYGARLQYFTATKSTEEISDEMLAARACAEVEGIKADNNFKIQGCASYSEEIRQKSQSISMQLKKFIRGGEKELRNQLLIAQALDPNVIKSFIDSADRYPQPIQYSLEPIWDLLPNDMAQQKANLYAYYTGYVQTGCIQKLAGDGSALKEFRKNPSDPKSFQCVIRSEGCHSGNDCNYNWGLAGCQCGGVTCVYHENGEPMVRNDPFGDLDDDMNRHCEYSTFSCDCYNNRPDYIVQWPTAPKAM